MHEDGGMDGQVDDHMDDQSGAPVLSAVERQAAESLLGDAWGMPVEVGAAEVVWKRDHVVRLGTRDGRSAILKRPHQHPDSGRLDREAFGTELASLEYLAGMPVPVAPRFLGADLNAGILLMEELPAGRSLANSLLLGDRPTATADLVAYATALGSLHGWSIGRTAEFEQARARYSSAADPQPWWLDKIERERGQFLRVASRLGVATAGVDREIDGLVRTLRGSRYRSFVHGDLCPDNVRLADGRMRIFDFEESSLGSAALDAAYLLAPFPSCWCFASVPADIADLAMGAYRSALQASDVEVGDDFDTELTAALAGWVVARGTLIERALERDGDWGTTTIRPRLMSWTERLAAAAAAAGTFPRLRMAAEGLRDRFRSLWPTEVIPAYPALAGPTSTRASVPAWWEPGL